MIHVIATIQLKEGTRAAFLAEFHKIVAPVREDHKQVVYVRGIRRLNWNCHFADAT